jgi:hypothetical protein
MKRQLTALLLAAACSAWAAPPTEASVERLLTLTRAEAVIDQVYAGIEQSMRQGMLAATAGRTLNAEQQRMIDLAPARLAAVMKQEMSWASMKADYIEIYRSSFEQAEIDGLIAFYESPAGQAFVAKMPTVVQKSMQVSQSRMQSFVPKLQAAMKDTLKEAGITQ